MPLKNKHMSLFGEPRVYRRVTLQSFLIFSLLIPLLLTSCLADYLNEKFGYSAPIYVSYNTKYGKAPSRKLIEKGDPLTSEYLPKLYADNNEFEGWYLDNNLYSIAQEGFIVNESITLYAKWKYENTIYPNNNAIIEVYFNLYNPDSEDGFVQQQEYTRTFYSEADFSNADFYIPDYECIPQKDDIYQNFQGNDENSQPMYTTVIQKYYYKTHINSSSLTHINEFLPVYSDYTYTFYFTNSNPDLGVIKDAGLPKIIIHLENCTDLREIPDNTFNNCSCLSQIYLPNTITKIGESAFTYCAELNFVSLQEGLTSIGNQAFIRCTTLCNISLPHTVTSIGQNLFGDCTSLSVAEISSISVTEIPYRCFLNCQQLESISIPYGTKYIYEEAFKDCKNLRSLYLPKSIEKIENNAFLNCENLTDIYCQEDGPPPTSEIYDEKIYALIGTDHWHLGQY